jgi:hypothetical protein
MRRRDFLRGAAAGAAALAAGPVLAATSYWSGERAIPAPVIPSPDIDISNGQSNMSNNYRSIGELGFNLQQQTVFGLKTSAMPGTIIPGPLSTGGILTREWGRIIGITPYGARDVISVGRAAAFAEQLLRVRAGITPVPILELCHAYPACTWLVCNNPDGAKLAPGGASWSCLEIGVAKVDEITAAGKIAAPRWRSVAYEQGGSNPDDPAQKVADLDAMFAAYDALGVLPANFPMFFLFQGLPSNWTNYNVARSLYETIPYCRANANGCSWMVAPIHAWPYNGGSNVHTDRYGTCRVGEMLAYARFVFYSEGLGKYLPLQLSLTAPLSVSGQVITVPWDRPSGHDYAAGTLSWQNDPDDGIKDWPQRGFHVFRGGQELTVSDAAIGGMTTPLTIAETLHPGDALEVSYAYYGPGGPDPGTCSGVGGNLAMQGPDSVLFPGKKLTAWAMPFLATATV